MPMHPVHRLAHQIDRPDGGTEWGCPECGHYLVCYSHTHIVVLHGAPDSVHIQGAGFPPDPEEVSSLSESDQQFLRRHAMAW
jgi:hypothetical protein